MYSVSYYDYWQKRMNNYWAALMWIATQITQNACYLRYEKQSFINTECEWLISCDKMQNKQHPPIYWSHSQSIIASWIRPIIENFISNMCSWFINYNRSLGVTRVAPMAMQGMLQLSLLRFAYFNSVIFQDTYVAQLEFYSNGRCPVHKLTPDLVFVVHACGYVDRCMSVRL